LLAIQQKTEQRILHLRNMIAALDALSEPSNTETIETLGLTDAIRSLFKSMPEEAVLTARDVRRRLHEMGFDRSKYSNFLASIHVVLRRLVQHGEIEIALRTKDEGGAGFRRKKEDWLADV